MWETFTNTQTLTWRKNFKSSVSISSLRKTTSQQPGAPLPDAQPPSNSMRNSITTAVPPAPFTTVYGVDASTTTAWLVPSTKSTTPLIKTTRTSSTSWKELSSSNVPNATTGSRETTDALLWLANADSSFAMSVGEPHVPMECAPKSDSSLSLSRDPGLWLDRTLIEKGGDLQSLIMKLLDIMVSLEPKKALEFGRAPRGHQDVRCLFWESRFAYIV